MNSIKYKNNDRYLILVAGAMILLGLTYAIQNSSVLFQGQAAKIEIDEEAYGETEFDSSNLKLIPILDKDAEISSDNVIRIDFKIGGGKDNSLKDDIIYNIALNDLKIDCDLISPYLKWKLIKNNNLISSGTLDYKFDTIKDGRLILTNEEQDLVKYSENKNDYDNYIFYMWLSDSCQDELGKCSNIIDQSYLTNKKISGKIEVEISTGEKQTLKRNPSDILDPSTCVNY